MMAFCYPISPTNGTRGGVLLSKPAWHKTRLAQHFLSSITYDLLDFPSQSPVSEEQCTSQGQLIGHEIDFTAKVCRFFFLTLPLYFSNGAWNQFLEPVDKPKAKQSTENTSKLPPPNQIASSKETA